MDADPAMRFFLKARNIVLKQEHVPTRAHIEVTVTDTVGITENVEPVKIRADGTTEAVASDEPSPPQAPTPAKSETTIEYTWYFVDLPNNVSNKDVVTLCAEHVAKLRAL
jgi:hypothetical protein